LAQATGFSFLLPIPAYFIYVALLAWLVTFIGLVRSLFNGLVVVFRRAPLTSRSNDPTF
jgi:hypothetical protein